MTTSSEPTREAPCFFDDNGMPQFRSSQSPKSVRVRAECKHPPHHPGIIIFVHGVNSTGEWFATAEKNLCEGLNTRLGLEDTPYALVPNRYSCDNIFDFSNNKTDNMRLPTKEQQTDRMRTKSPETIINKSVNLATILLIMVNPTSPLSII